MAAGAYSVKKRRRDAVRRSSGDAGQTGRVVPDRQEQAWSI